MINQEGDAPGDADLEEGHKPGPAPAFRFLFDSGKGGGAGDIEQGEGHQGIGVQGAEAHSAQTA